MMMQQENSLLLNSRKNDGWISSFIYNRRSISICFGMFISSLSWIHYVNYVKYYLLQYRRLCDVIRKGDLREYDNIVKDYEYVLIQRGLYVCNKMIKSINQSIIFHLPIFPSMILFTIQLVILSLKILVERSFLKHVVEASGLSQIPFKFIHQGLNLFDKRMTDDELCSLLSMLKYRVCVFASCTS